jgi:hypothetical protein
MFENVYAQYHIFIRDLHGRMAISPFRRRQAGFGEIQLDSQVCPSVLGKNLE